MLFDKVQATLGEITPYIATISSRNCNNLKSMVEESIYQIINAETQVIFRIFHIIFFIKQRIFLITQ